MKARTLRDVPMPVGAGATSNMHGTKRPVLAIPAETIRAARNWSKAYLPGYTLSELEVGLSAVMKHPDQAARGYSPAKDARSRLQLEINRRKALPPTV
jgi:hypothetical protein